MPPTPAAAKTERLLNLVLALLSTRRPLTKGQIRAAVPQYEQSDDAAFDRMFERDKDELRDLSIPIVTEHIDTFFLDEPGYRIDRREYALPPIEFSPEEIEVLGLASRTWSEGVMAPRATAALRKLAAAGVDTGDDGPSQASGAAELVVGTSEPAFEPLRAAVTSRTPVTFGYLKAGVSEPSRRRLLPWRLQAWHGRWYVTGFDLDRGEPRVFRLQRVAGEVATEGRPGSYDIPADHDATAMIRRSAAPSAGGVAVLHVARGAGFDLRRRARPDSPGPETAGERRDDGADDTGTGAERPGEPAPPGFETLSVEFDEVTRMAEDVAAYGPDVVVVGPPRLRECVLALLRGAAEAHGAGRVG